MAHGNKKKRENSKKKGSRERPPPEAARANDSRVVETSNIASAASAIAAAAAALQFPKFTSCLKDQGENERPKNHSETSIKGLLYVCYKKSTQDFKDALQCLVPIVIDTVHAFAVAADYIVEHDLEVEGTLLTDLKRSIRGRQRMSEGIYGDGDDGHLHFNATLSYCWSLLRPRRKKREYTPIVSEDDPNVPMLCNRFDGLSTAHGAPDDDEDDEEDMPQSPQPRPIASEETHLSLQELINGTDRTNTITFLVTLDDLMKGVALQYSQLNRASARVQGDSTKPNSTLVGQLMQASTAANFAIQQATALEQAFIADHPHLNTVYRVMTYFVGYPWIPLLTATVMAKSPIASQFSERHAVGFVGDAIECAFRDKADPFNKAASLVSDFLDRWQFQDDPPLPKHFTVQQLFTFIDTAVSVEITRDWDRMQSLGKFLEATPYSWLIWFDYIGSDRSITSAIQLLQWLSFPLLHLDAQVVLNPEKGLFGVSWLDRDAPASRIQVDMFTLMMEDIVPALVNLCKTGMLSKNIPYQEELFTGLAPLKSFVKQPNRPVSWSLAFALHVISTAVFETQGQQLDFLANIGREAFQTFFDQLEMVETKCLAAVAELSPKWKNNLAALKGIKKVMFVAETLQRPEQAKLSFWNPYCAGIFLSFLTYYGNLDGGITFVDSVGQLRTTLHLFHALEQVRDIRPGQVAVLSHLVKIFADCHAIWKGRPPIQGQFRARWRTAIANYDGSMRPVVSNRKIDRTIVLEHLSKSYCAVCLREVGSVDNGKGTRRRVAKHDPLGGYKALVRNTLRSLAEDEPLFATNWMAMGLLLHQFVLHLVNRWGWMSAVDEMMDSAPLSVKQEMVQELKYQFIASLFEEDVLKPLDNGDRLVASRCAKIVDDYFHAISLDDLMWFAPNVQSDDVTQQPP